MKKFLVLLLSVVMLFTLGTITALATDTGNETTGVAKIGENEYATLEKAFASAQEGDTVTLLANITADVMIKAPENIAITLDLNGYTIEAASGVEFVLYITTGDTVTIEDSKGNGGIVNNNTYGYGVLNQGTLVINGGSFVGDAALWNGYDTINATATINGGTFATSGGEYGYSIGNSGTMIISNATVTDILSSYGSLTIDGGEYEWVTAYSADDEYQKTVAETSTTINGGTITLFESATTSITTATNDVKISGGDIETVELWIEEGASVKNKVEISAGTVDAISAYTYNDEGETEISATHAGISVTGGTLGQNALEAVATVKIGESYYLTLAEAITAANAMTGDVVVEIYGKVEYTDTTANLTGSYSKITFVGKTDDAEISLVRSNGVIIYGTSTQNVAFEDIILSRPNGKWVDDIAHMGYFFAVYRIATVTYTNCQFPDGACAQNCTAVYDNCTFYNNTYGGKYSLWVYAGVDCTVKNCTFANDRGIKMYAEGAAKNTNLTVTNTSFANCTAKPAIVLGYGESVTLSGNTYSSNGVFELDAACDPNGTTITADITDIACMNDNYTDCGVIVDGKIYVTLTDAVDANAVTGESTVTLMYSTEEAVELPAGTTLETNGYTAENVTIAKTYVAQIGENKYETITDAITAAQDGETIVLITNIEISEKVVIEKAITLDLNGYTITATSQKAIEVYANTTIKNGTIKAVQRCVDTRTAVELTLDSVTLIADEYTSNYGNPQPLTIGGYDNGTVVTLNNVKMSAKDGYCIISFVETDLIATNCELVGYSALYVKPGSEGSVFNFVACDLTGDLTDNDVAGNSMSVIAVQTNDVTINLDADSTITASGNNSCAFSFGTTTGANPIYVSDVKIESNATLVGNVLGTDCIEDNTLIVPADYANTLKNEGFVVKTNENGTVSPTQKAVSLEEVFTFKGYSVCENGVGVTAGYTVDKALFEAYCEQNGVTITLGAVYAATELNANAIYKSFAGLDLTTNYNISLKDMEEDHKSLAFVMALYIEINGEKQFVTTDGTTTAIVDATKVEAITYNGVATKEDNE